MQVLATLLKRLIDSGAERVLQLLVPEQFIHDSVAGSWTSFDVDFGPLLVNQQVDLHSEIFGLVDRKLRRNRPTV